MLISESRFEKNIYKIYALLFLLTAAGLVVGHVCYIAGIFSVLPQLILSLAVCMLAVYVVRKISISERAIRFTAAFFCAIPCVYGLTLLMDSFRSVLWVMLYFGISYVLYNCMWTRVEKSTERWAFFLAVLFAGFVFLGRQLGYYGRLELLYFGVWEEPRFYQLCRWIMSGLGLSFLFYVILKAGLNYLSGISFVNTEKNRKEEKFSVKRTFIQTIILLLLWLPIYIAFYPGLLFDDSVNEIHQQLGLTQLNGSNPILHQLLIRFGLSIGTALGGGVQMGVAVYSLIQIAFLSLSISVAVEILRNVGVNRLVLTLTFLFYAIFAENPFYGISMLKDTIFACAALLLTAIIIKDIASDLNEKGGKSSKVLLVFMVIASLIFATIRHNGLLAFILGFAAIVICYKQNRKKYLIIFSIVCVVLAGYHVIIDNTLKAEKMRTAESLSIPLQQIARTVTVHGEEEMDSEEIEILREVFPRIEELSSLYKSYLSDPVKAIGVFESEVFDEDPMRYMGCWLRLGIRHPVTYMDAFFLMNYGYWYPEVNIGERGFGGIVNDLDVSHPDKFAPLRQRLNDVFAYIAGNEVSSIMYGVAWNAWLLLICFALLNIKGQREYALSMLILFAIWLPLFGSAVFGEYRYAYPLAMCAPFFLAFSIAVEPKNKRTSGI